MGLVIYPLGTNDYYANTTKYLAEHQQENKKNDPEVNLCCTLSRILGWCCKVQIIEPVVVH